ncbi:hypothetical protein NLB65_01270 [Candidatus Aminicenantes bacterium AC-335-B20]|jgi:hypothetical protein|nr:hypothetical protein [SCandidatus Aminicenantes bacterium Aminicenantia_JdfR_composite]MCP2596311.1 hypothetical protein [Candidatus Aminicenantes bacterium AC-335-G13]MCP2599074.1 hypothetical protein [Candidatus Aminicenantes bacterium AC-335-B20]MCP2606406.1 hypothetical protein [Candidatus Aminicenantes bacterium AC-708-I09]MCP2617786.1 hypothetical protein [Candidatus Aminicenantes bacterium AC-335-A11]
MSKKIQVFLLTSALLMFLVFGFLTIFQKSMIAKVTEKDCLEIFSACQESCGSNYGCQEGCRIFFELCMSMAEE